MIISPDSADIIDSDSMHNCVHFFYVGVGAYRRHFVACMYNIWEERRKERKKEKKEKKERKNSTAATVDSGHR